MGPHFLIPKTDESEVGRVCASAAGGGRRAPGIDEKVTGRNETGRKIVIMADGRQMLQTGVARWELFDVVVSRTVGLAERYVAGTVSAASLKDEMTKVMVT